ncbi:MAG TPA: N-acetyl-gamma-glutamyl-phosphate reductase [Cellulomonas sp.]
MSFSVAVAGASGYAGGEALRLLLGHPEARIGALTARANAGSRLGEHHLHLRELADRVLVPTSAENLAGHDVVVLGLPHGASGEIAAQLDSDTIVIDLGADHRLTDADAWSQFYGGAYAGSWPYGLPELLHAGEVSASAQRGALAGVTRIAVPGCNVTAVTLGLQPGIAAGLVEPTDLVAVLANGYSGAGKTLKGHLLASEAFGSAQPYGVGGVHRHVPEIEQNLRVAGAADVTISFTPTLVPMARGILATATARLAPGIDPATVRAAWESAYADEPFVQLLPLDRDEAPQWPTTAATLGSNTALVQMIVDVRAGRVVTVTAIDNLVKGTAGGALQSLNLALGLPELLGLTTNGVSP